MRYLVIGAAGHAQEVAWSVRESERSRGAEPTFEFFDDRVEEGPLPSGLGNVLGAIHVAGRRREAGDRFVLGVALPRLKAALVERLSLPEEHWATVVHPAAAVGANVRLGVGTYVGAGAVLTVNVDLGRWTTVNTHCVVSHGATLGDFAALHPGSRLSGEARVGAGAEIGAGAVVLPGVVVGDRAVLGAGGVATSDLDPDGVWAGVPARLLASAVGASGRKEASS